MSYFEVRQLNPPPDRFGCGSCRLGEPPAPSAEDLQYEQDLANNLKSIICPDMVIQHIQKLTEPLERCLTDILFSRRHPDQRGKQLTRSDKDTPFVQEWKTIRKDIARPNVARYIDGLVFDIRWKRKDICRFLRVENLSKVLQFAANPVVRNPNGTTERAPQEFIDEARGSILFESRNLSLSAETYAEIGCPTAELQTVAKAAEQLAWPSDREMQNERSRLLAALQRALARAAVK